jgi:hypothetical protein
MHTYDPDRHTWRYDVGGYAWDNSELSPDLFFPVTDVVHIDFTCVPCQGLGESVRIFAASTEEVSFLDYGDFMHTYDPDRHTWRYDVGGYAWDNSELSKMN